MRSIYLAGPEVFLPDAAAVGQEKKRLCETHGFLGLFPLDAELSLAQGDASRAIFDANAAMIRRCDAIIANLTPFRGASADAGTVFEIGMAFGLGKPIFAYTNVSENYAVRVLGGRRPAAGAQGLVAEDGLGVEDFGLFDNLMIAQAIRAQGRDVVAQEAAPESRYTDLAGFELCLRQAAAHFAARG